MLHVFEAVHALHSSLSVPWLFCMQLFTQSMTSLIICSGIGAFERHSLWAKLAEGGQQTWDGLHVSHRTAPPQRQKTINIIIIGLAAQAGYNGSPVMSCQ